MGYTPPQLEVRKITGGYSIFPPTLTANDDLTIYPNGTDTAAKLVLNGGSIGGVQLYLSGDTLFQVYDGASLGLNVGRVTASTHYAIISKIDAYDLYLGTTGTGVLKFGTYTAGAATDSTGYITIKDAAGNTRKLMVQA